MAEKCREDIPGSGYSLKGDRGMGERVERSGRLEPGGRRGVPLIWQIEEALFAPLKGVCWSCKPGRW